MRTKLYLIYVYDMFLVYTVGVIDGDISVCVMLVNVLPYMCVFYGRPEAWLL